MPDFPFQLTDGRVNRERAISLGFVDHTGVTQRTQISGLGTFEFPWDNGELSNFRDKAGALSNMGVFEMKDTETTFIAKRNAQSFDEAFGAGIVLQVVLENNNGEEISFYLPAPDASIFAEDGVTLVDRTTNGDVDDFLNATENLINNSFQTAVGVGANSFSFVRGIRRSHKVSLPRGAGTGAALAEPGAGDSPGDDPAT